MKITRNLVRWKPIVLVIMLALVLAGCANTRQGISWPALDTVQIDDTTYLLVAYEQQVELLDLTTGNVARLLDSEGEQVLDADGNPQNWVIAGSEYDNAQFFADPVVTEDDGQQSLLLPTYNGRLLEFYAATARPVNAAGIAIGDGVLAEIVSNDQYFFVPYRSGDLVALNRETLEIDWRVDTNEGIWASPLLNDGVLYIPSVDHLLYAVDAATGDVLWTVDLEGAVAASPVLYNDALYIGSWSHSMYKISLDGDVLATHEGENWIWGTPTIFDGIVYYTDLSGNVYALDAENLSLVWQTKPADRGIRPGPIVSDDYVVVASRNGIIYWLDRESGTEVYEREMEGTPEILSEMLLIEANEENGISESMVIVGAGDRNNMVAAFALDNGIPIWVHGR